MTTIYIVTTGSYSDKGNYAVFSKIEDAEMLVHQLNEHPYAEASIEEFEVDAIGFLRPREDKRWFVRFSFANSVVDVAYQTEFWTDADRGIDEADRFWTHVATDKKEDAAKIAMERRSAWIANNNPLMRRWYVVFKADSDEVIYISENLEGWASQRIGNHSDGGIYVVLDADTEEKAVLMAKGRRLHWLTKQPKAESHEER